MKIVFIILLMLATPLSLYGEPNSALLDDLEELSPESEFIEEEPTKKREPQVESLPQQNDDPTDELTRPSIIESHPIETVPPMPETPVHNEIAPPIASPPQPPLQTAVTIQEKQQVITEEQTLFSVSGTMDLNYTTGNSVTSGFSLPSMRFSFFGDLTKNLHYQMSFGQTKEFSSVLLPQLLPVEAFVNIKLDDNLQWKSGMFTPSFNPSWSNDLSQLSSPAYAKVHRELFLSRDLGTELSYHPYLNHIKLSVGYFNGNGILSPNNNHSKAVVGTFELKTQFDSNQIRLGISAYRLQASTVGALNFQSNWVSHFFTSFETKWLSLYSEVAIGKFDTSSTTYTPTGILAGLSFSILDEAELFFRGESLRAQPSGQAGVLQHYQGGVSYFFEDRMKYFIFFDHINIGSGTPENSLQMQMRLIL